IAAPPVTIAAGSRGEAVLTLTIQPTWHINANPPSPDYMIATEAKLTNATTIAAGAAIYPAPRRRKGEVATAPLAVLTGTARIRIPLTASALADSGARTMSGTLRFQACNDQVCLAPATIPFQVAVTVTGGGAPSAIRAPVPETASGPATDTSAH